MLNSFWQYIGKSVWTGPRGKISTTRIQSYLILGSIFTSTIVFISIDIVNAIIKWRLNEIYEVPIQHITLFGMVLAHHLALLGINKNSENKAMDVYKEVQSNITPNSTELSTETPVKESNSNFEKDEEAV